MTLEVNDQVSISGEHDFNSGTVKVILLSDLNSEYRGYVVEINREKVQETPWGMNWCLIDLHKLKKVG